MSMRMIMAGGTASLLMIAAAVGQDADFFDGGGAGAGAAPAVNTPPELERTGQTRGLATDCGVSEGHLAGGGVPAGCNTGTSVLSAANPIGTALPDAVPGQCFARVRVPAVYDTVPQTVVTQEAYQALNVSDPQFAPETVNIKVKDESLRYVVRPARYETQTEQVLVKPAYERLTVVPAQFDIVNETITVDQPRLVWRKGRNLSGISRIDPDTGAVYCLVEEPAETMTVQKRVLRVPEQVRATQVPAQYITVTKEVLVDPGGVDQFPVPAEFRDVAVSRLVTPAASTPREVAVETRDVPTRVLRTPERFEWTPVLCETNATVASISNIQSALAAGGYYQGEIDGIAGPQTEAAIKAFQRAEGLPGNGVVTVDTLDALNLGHLLPVREIETERPVAERVSASPLLQAAALTTADPALPASVEPTSLPLERQALRGRTERRLTWVGR